MPPARLNDGRRARASRRFQMLLLLLAGGLIAGGAYFSANTIGKLRESISLDGLVPEDGLKTALRALHRRDGNFQPDKIDAERVYTNVFARKAKDKFRA